MEQGGVGVVVIGRNEGQRLLACLASMLPLGIALVYVDSGSSDGSCEAVRRLGVPVHQLDPSRPFSAARARNEGMSAIMSISPGLEFVQFVDGDCEMAPDWVHKAVAFLSSHPEVAIVCGRRRERYPDRSIYNRLMDMEWDSPIGKATACGGDSLVRVQAFLAVGGFNPRLIAGEEPELCSRLRAKGWLIWRLDEEMTLHDADIMRFGQLWRRGVRSGYAEAEIAYSNPASRLELAQTFRAVFWAAVIPALAVLGGLLYWPLILLLLLYPLQVFRIAFRRGASERESWLYAVIMTALKFAQLQGIIRFVSLRMTGSGSRLIEYKALPSKNGEGNAFPTVGD